RVQAPPFHLRLALCLIDDALATIGPTTGKRGYLFVLHWPITFVTGAPHLYFREAGDPCCVSLFLHQTWPAPRKWHPSRHATARSSPAVLTGPEIATRCFHSCWCCSR